MAKHCERLRQALEVKGWKPSMLSYKTGISEASLSHYLAGHYEPKAQKMQLLANTLKVSVAWLSGFDVPMIDETVKTTIDEKTQFLIELFNEVPEAEQDKVINLIKVALGKYDL